MSKTSNLDIKENIDCRKCGVSDQYMDMVPRHSRTRYGIRRWHECVKCAGGSVHKHDTN